MDLKNRIPAALLITELFMLTASLILAREKLTWILEVFPIIAGLPILIFTYRRFRLTSFLYVLLLLHSLILITGGYILTRRFHSASGCRTASASSAITTTE